MNILEAYIKQHKQLIILILGLPCTNKSEIAKELQIDLNLPLMKINDYLDRTKIKEINVDNYTFKVYGDVEFYNYEKLNEDVNSKKTDGVILYGNNIDGDKINFLPDFVFFYSMGSTLCKKILIEKNMMKIKGDEPINVYFEKIFNPMYEELKKKIKINKFFNIKETMTFDNVYDETFDLLMELVSKKLKQQTQSRHYLKYPKYSKYSKHSKQSRQSRQSK